VRSSESENAITLTAATDTGQLVFTADSMATRTIPADQLARLRGQGATAQDALFRERWIALRALGAATEIGQCAVIGKSGSWLAAAAKDGGRPVMNFEDLAALRGELDAGTAGPEVVYLDATPGPAPAGTNGGATDVPDRVLDQAAHVLETVQEWIADERLQQSRLVVVTERAVVANAEARLDHLAGAGIWGLMRSAQTENPNRFVLVDVDSQDASIKLLQEAVATADSDPQLALRQGKLLAPRLARVSGSERDAGTEPGAEDKLVGEIWDPERTVLITGGTGLLGGLLARHLVGEHGMRSLLLASRQGKDASQAEQLREDLERLGARVEITACDVSDRKALRKLLRSIPKEHPLGAVVHAAGALDDGVIQSLTRERLQRVLAPKVNAAWHLHQLTEQHDLNAFVIISSAAGMLGSPGQANYAAANAFLDALASHRRARGLPATSIAWGLWAPTSDLTSSLTDVAHARMQRFGLRALTVEQGLELFDRAVATNEPLVLAAPLDRATLRTQAQRGVLSPLLRELIRVPPSRAPDATRSLAHRLAEHPQAEHQRIVLDLLRTEIAGVLAHPNPRSIDPHRSYKELGFDSLTAVELRNRLNTVTGLRLAASLIFDHPTPTQTAKHILDEARNDDSHEALVDAHIDALKGAIAAIAPEHDARRRITARLQALLGLLDTSDVAADRASVEQRLTSASADEVLAFIDRELR
jgi:pimaricinolide synthase PimS1